MFKKRLAAELADLVIEVRRLEFEQDEAEGREPNLFRPGREELIEKSMKLPPERLRVLIEANRQAIQSFARWSRHRVMVRELENFFK